jgi:hypothetical protein
MDRLQADLELSNREMCLLKTKSDFLAIYTWGCLFESNLYGENLANRIANLQV